MSTPERLDRQIHDIRTLQIAAYQEKIRADKAEQARLEKTASARHKREQEVLRKIGLDLEQLDQEQHEAEKELGGYLEEARVSVVSRPSAQARDTKAHALLAELNAQAGHLALPPYASTLFGANASVFEGVDGEGEITNGWVSPSSSTRIKFETHFSGTGLGPVEGTPPSSACTSASRLRKLLLTPCSQSWHSMGSTF